MAIPKNGNNNPENDAGIEINPEPADNDNIVIDQGPAGNGNIVIEPEPVNNENIVIEPGPAEEPAENAPVFSSTEDYRAFAGSLRRAILQDNELFNFVKRRQGKDPEKDTSELSEEELMDALDGLGNTLATEENEPATRMTDNIRNFADMLRDLKAAEESQNPQEAADRCRDAVEKLKNLNSGNMTEAAKEYLKGGKHQDIPEADRDADDLYDAVQKNIAGMFLLRCGNLVADGAARAEILERKTMFSNFMTQDFQLAQMDRQEEISFFAGMSEEEQAFLTLEGEEQEAKARELAAESNEYIGQMERRDIWFAKNAEAKAALEKFRQSEEIQKLYDLEARKLATPDAEKENAEYRRKLVDEARRKMQENIKTDNYNKDIDARRKEVADAREEYSKKCQELKAAIPTGKTQEQAFKELSEKIENPEKIRERIKTNQARMDSLSMTAEKLRKAYEYPRKIRELQLDAASKLKEERLQEKRKALSDAKWLKVRTTTDLGKDGRLNLEMTGQQRKEVMDACAGLQKAYSDRDAALDKILEKYQKSLKGLKESDSRYQAKKAELENARKEAVTKAEAEFGKKKEKALAGLGNQQRGIILILSGCNRSFPEKAPFTPEMFSPKNIGNLDTALKTMEDSLAKDEEAFRELNPEYSEMKAFLDSPDFQGTKLSTAKALKDWDPADLKLEHDKLLMEAQGRSAQIQADKKQLNQNLKLFAEAGETIKLLPSEGSIKKATQELEEYEKNRKAEIDALEKSIPNKKKFIKTADKAEIDALTKKHFDELLARKSRDEQVKKQAARNLEPEVRDCFLKQNPLRKEFIAKAEKRTAEIARMLDHAADLKNPEGRINGMFLKRVQAFESNGETVQRWESQLNRQNEYPDRIKNRLDELFSQINAGKKKGHEDTQLFKNMSGALAAARNFFYGPDGEANMNGLRRMDPEATERFNALLDNLKNHAQIYEAERKRGIHWIASNMHHVRLNFAKNLQNFAGGTKAGLAELAAAESVRKKACRDAIQKAKNRAENEPEPPKDIKAFINDAFQQAKNAPEAQMAPLQSEENIKKSEPAPVKEDGNAHGSGEKSEEMKRLDLAVRLGMKVLGAVSNMADELAGSKDPESLEKAAGAEALAKGLDSFINFADKLDYDMDSQAAKKSIERAECLERLAKLGRPAAETGARLASGISDPEARKEFTDSLNAFIEVSNMAVEEYREINPMEKNLKPSELVLEEEPAEAQDEPVKEAEEVKEEPAVAPEEPAPEKAPGKAPFQEASNAPAYNRGEMRKILEWCAVISEISNKYFADDKVMAPKLDNTLFSLKDVREAAEKGEARADNEGEWAGDVDSDMSLEAIRRRAHESEDDKYERSGEHAKEEFKRTIGEAGQRLAGAPVELQDQLSELLMQRREDDPESDNSELASDLAKYNEALRNLVQYSKDIAEDFNRDKVFKDQKLALPKVPEKLAVQPEDEVDLGRLLKNGVRSLSDAAMNSLGEISGALKKSDDPEQNSKDSKAVSDAINAAQEPYTFAVDMLSQLKENPDAFSSPEAKLKLYKDISEKLTAALKGMVSVKKNQMDNCSLPEERKQAFAQTAVKMARLQKLVAIGHNRLAKNSGIEAGHLAEINVGSLEARMGIVKKEEPQAAEEKKAPEKKAGRRAPEQKPEIRHISAGQAGDKNEPGDSSMIDRLKKLVIGEENLSKKKAAENKKLAEKSNAEIQQRLTRMKQYAEYFPQHQEELREQAYRQGILWVDFKKEHMENFLKLSDKEVSKLLYPELEKVEKLEKLEKEKAERQEKREAKKKAEKEDSKEAHPEENKKSEPKGPAPAKH